MDGIKVNAIIELLGSPKEHVEKSMNLLADSISKKYKVLNKKIKEPVKQGEKFYLTFIDLELIIPATADIIAFILDYMPSSIEIVEPDEIKDDSGALTEILNDLIQKIHRLDMELKIQIAKNKLMEKSKSEAKK